jgi:thiol-disulfide isomerase/thioredoxin
MRNFFRLRPKPLFIVPSTFSSGSSTAPLQKSRRWMRWGAEIGLVILFLFVLQWWQARDVPHGAAPSFTALMAGGRSVSLDEWRATHPGKTVGVYFWADWCPICKAQEGSVDALRADWPVLTVAMHSGDTAAVSKVLRERGLDWPTAIDADGGIASRYGLHGVPALVVVDGRGEIHSVMVGYTTALGMRLRLWRAALGD